MTTRKNKNSPVHDIARITSVTGRSGNISAARLLIEKALEDHAGTPLTQAQIAQVTGLKPVAINNPVHNMVVSKWAEAVPTDHPRVLAYVKRGTQATSQPAPRDPEPPIRNSNRPNGSTEFWARHIKAMNTPARLEVAA